MGATPSQICLLSCSSGSCENWAVQASTLESCNIVSQAYGCGDCKSRASWDSDLQEAMKTVDSDFVTLCTGSDAKPAGRNCADGIGDCGLTHDSCVNDSDCCASFYCTNPPN